MDSFNYKQITFTLAPKHIEYLNDRAESIGTSRSDLVRLIIERDMQETGYPMESVLKLRANK